MKALLIASLLASATSFALGQLVDGTYSVACNEQGHITNCKVVNGSTTVNSPGFFEAGYADYLDHLNITGWDKITVNLNETTPTSDLSLNGKYFGMGYVEGFVTYDRIYYNYANVKDEFTNMITADTLTWWNNNAKFLDDFVATNPSDPYAIKVGNLRAQVRGLAAGYLAGCNFYTAGGCPAEWTVIDEQMMFMINWQAEIGDVYSAYQPNSEISKAWHSPENSHCSALIKVIPNDLFLSHVAWTGFSWMMRQYKIYNFEGKNYVTIAGHPGMIHSMDDWYMTGRGLASTETTMIVNNVQLFVDNLNGKYNYVPSFIRAMVANYLADTTTEWMAMFARLQSGTYNNQWMVIDMKLYTGDASNLRDGLFGVIETLPGSYVAADQTQFLRDNNHWPSYNFAFYPEMQKLANYASMFEQYGEGMTFNGYNRARIFARDNHKVVDAHTMEDMMTYNDYLNDDLSIIPNCTGATGGVCNPNHSAMLTISSRGDLNPPGTEANYGIMVSMVGQRNHGGIDLKVASWSGMMNSNGKFIARIRNGPTTSNGLPTFNFSQCAIQNIPHQGMPDVYDFGTFSFTTQPKIPPTLTPNGDEYDNTGMGTALLIISLVIIVFSGTMLVVCHFLPKRQYGGYTQV